jgi:hypothetical protein
MRLASSSRLPPWPAGQPLRFLHSGGSERHISVDNMQQAGFDKNGFTNNKFTPFNYHMMLQQSGIFHLNLFSPLLTLSAE